MKRIINSWVTLAMLVFLFIAGLGMRYVSNVLDAWESPQIQLYNEGLAYLQEEKIDEAMMAFDKSLDIYRSQAERKFSDSLIYPPRSTKTAAQAQAKKVVLYIIKQKPELAVKAAKESLLLAPGNTDAKVLAKVASGEALTAEDIDYMAGESYFVRHNLELLYKQRPSLQQKEGKGKGKPKDGKGDPGDEPATRPGPGSGKGNPDAL